MDMKPIIETLPLAIAAAFSPSGLLFVMLIMSGKKGKKGALLFNIGGIAFLTTVVIVFDLVIRIIGGGQKSSDPTVSCYIDIFLGILIVFITLRNIFKKSSKESKVLQLPLFVFGFVYMGINLSSLIPFIAADKTLLMSNLAPLPYFISVVVLIIVAMSLMLFPVIVEYMLPNRSQKVLAPIEKFMQKHGKILANGYFLLIAVYLIIRSIVQLL
jgi:hypothetical protein